ncbi:hypothetical protein BH09BAC2_BH09BAC2_21600 [soil metagenome]
MLSSSEKNFIKNWQDQKEGPKWKYYLQYSFAWTVVSFLCLFFLIKLIMSDRNMGGITSFYIVLPISILIGFLITHLVYSINEKKLNLLLQKQKESNGSLKI